MRLKSRLLSLFLVVAMLLGSTPIPTIGSEIIRVTIDGVPLSLDVPPVVMSGRTLVPLRAIFEALGASVTWDDAAQRIAGARGSRTIVLYLGRNVAYIDGAAVTLDVAPTAVRGRTMVPARFVAESLGATVSWNETKLTVEITRAIPVTSLSLNPANLALVVTGGPAQLTVTVLPPNATDQRLNWQSSDPDVATVSPTGLVTPIAPGRTHITVTSADGGCVAKSEMTVTAAVVSVTGIALSHVSHTLPLGETLQLVATLTPSNATKQDVSWLSTNPDVASVTAEGLVTAFRVGTARITATSTDGGRVATSEVTVQATAVVLSLTSIGETSGSGNHLKGAAVAVSTTVPAGQRFVNWSHGTTVVSIVASFAFTMPASNVSLVANFRVIYVDPNSPTIKFCALGITLLPSDVLKLRKKGEDIAVAMQVSGSTVFIGRTTAPQSAPTPPGQSVFVGHAGGSNVLDFYQDYVLTVYQATGHRYEFSFATSGLPLLANESPIRQIILIPAMPEKGFYWPYLLAIPHIGHRAANVEHRRYLMVDGTNTGRFGTFAEAFAMTKRDIANGGRTMVRVADALWSPLLIPVFPRPLVDYVYGGEVNRFYTHALDRDSVLLRSRMKDPILRATLIRAFAVHNINVQHLERLDLQLIAMIDHAVGYLNSQRFDLEPDKIFMYGFSASGDFSKRFSTLHPERIRAVYSGAAINSMMLPLAQHRGKNLIYPIGVYDYKAITGRDFCMARHNQVARLLHRGDQDTNEPLHFPADYSARERAIVIALWGAPMQPRIRQLIELYGQSGGHGMFILDRGIGHGESPAMVQFIIEFFKANRDGDVPVYPIPSNPAQLMYTLFQ